MAELDKVLTGVGSIASPVSSIGGSIVNGIFQSRENRKNRKWTEQQNELAWQRQNQLINEQRVYDSPKEQMKRLMDAGLNPNLIYGDLGGNMQAQSAPNAAGSYQGVAPQVDPLALSQSLLNMANARKAEQETRLSYEQANRIVNMTPKEFELLNANIDRIKQQINLDSANEELSKIRKELYSDPDYEIEYKGDTFSVRDALIKIFGNEIANKHTESVNAIRLFWAQVLGAERSADKIRLENADLREYIKVCADIYKGQASQSAYLGSMADMNKDLYEKLGASESAISTIGKLLLSLISTSGGLFSPRR